MKNIEQILKDISDTKFLKYTAKFPKVRNIYGTKIFKRMFELYQSDGGDKTFTEFKHFYEYSVTMLDAMFFDNLERRVIMEFQKEISSIELDEKYSKMADDIFLDLL